jgi:hypothetical protein
MAVPVPPPVTTATRPVTSNREVADTSTLIMLETCQSRYIEKQVELSPDGKHMRLYLYHSSRLRHPKLVSQPKHFGVTFLFHSNDPNARTLPKRNQQSPKQHHDPDSNPQPKIAKRVLTNLTRLFLVSRNPIMEFITTHPPPTRELGVHAASTKFRRTGLMKGSWIE